MSVNSSVDRNAILAARQNLIAERGNGFRNILGKELGDWFSTRRWIVQTIIWLTLINGLMAFILFVVPTMDPSEQVPREEIASQAAALYFSFSVTFGSIGIIILSQDELIQEKQTGTAAWILSKPVSRTAFVLSKVLSNLIGALIFITALPAALAYVEISSATQKMQPVLPYLMGVGVILLTLFFYLTLVIMLGAFFEQRGPVLGISFTLLFGGMIAAQFSPQLAYILPVNMQDIAAALAMSQSLPPVAVSQVVFTAIWCVVFTVLALWRFNRLEF